MLVLSRKEGEAICIGESIEIRVIRLRSGSVRLGVTCPREIPVHREEVRERLRAEHNRVIAHMGVTVKAK